MERGQEPKLGLRDKVGLRKGKEAGSDWAAVLRGQDEEKGARLVGEGCRVGPEEDRPARPDLVKRSKRSFPIYSRELRIKGLAPSTTNTRTKHLWKLN